VLFALAEMLRVNTTIEDLVIESNALDDSACIALAEAVAVNRVLRRLHLDCMAKGTLSDMSGIVMAAAVRSNSTLKVLNILGSSCAIGDDTGSAMADAMAGHQALNSLRLAGQNLGDESGVAMAKALKVNNALEHVLLAGRGICSTSEFTFEMIDALRTNTTLKSLTVENHHVSDEAGATLAQILDAGSSLESLRVVCAGIGDHTGAAMAEGLRSNSTLKELLLDGLNIDDATLLSVAAALEVNTHLTSLSLINPCLHIGVCSELFVAVERALTTNTTLRSLTLSVGYLGDDLCIVVAEALKVNTTLHSLELHGVGIGTSTVNAMAVALRSNATLKSLQLNWVGPGTEVEKERNEENMLGGPETWQWTTTTPGSEICAALARNAGLPEQWRLLAWLSRNSTVPSVRALVAAMTEEGFQRAVFAYFLPPAVNATAAASGQWT